MTSQDPPDLGSATHGRPNTFPVKCLRLATRSGIALSEHRNSLVSISGGFFEFGWSQRVVVDIERVQVISQSGSTVVVACELGWRRSDGALLHLDLYGETAALALIAALPNVNDDRTVQDGEETVKGGNPDSLPPCKFYGVRYDCEASRPGSRASTGLFEQFFRQQDAFDCVDRAREAGLDGVGNARLLVMSSEDAAKNGRRMFAVASLGKFFESYLRTPPGARHWYELIREDQPCRLYMDLEFTTAEGQNAKLNGNAMVAMLIEMVAEHALRRFGLLLSRSCFMVLDSTVPGRKFSQHIILHFPDGSLFKNNRECGAFVREVVRLSPGGEHALRVECNGRFTCLVDLSVYTRNRAFRFWLSSKFGKKKWFDVAETNTFPCYDDDEEGTRALFEASLVCPPAVGRRLLSIPSDRPTTVPANSVSLSSCRSGISAARALVSLQPPSPFPLLESFVLRLASSTNGVPARISRYSLRREKSFLEVTLYLARNRFCHRIGRAHRSNNVFYVARSTKDGKEHYVFQSCFDPDCCGYRSIPWEFPAQVCRSIWDASVMTKCDS